MGIRRNLELREQIRALQKENDELRYELTDDPTEAIWLKLSPRPFEAGPMMVLDVVGAASRVVREGKISRDKMINYLLGPDENKEN